MKSFELWVWFISSVGFILLASLVGALVNYYRCKGDSYTADAENTRAQTAAKGDDGEGWKSNA